jgi:hypothetical protein
MLAAQQKNRITAIEKARILAKSRRLVLDFSGFFCLTQKPQKENPMLQHRVRNKT